MFAGLLLLCACSRTPETKTEAPKQAAPAPATATAVKVKFDTTKGPFVVEVYPDAAPLGAKRFLELVEDKFYDGAGIFRVVPNYVMQFGIAGKPAVTKKWKDKRIDDDPVKRTNRLGSIAFASEGPNTRTTQVYINLRTNQTLDNQGFTPFGQIVQGMETVEKIYAGHGERPDQSKIEKQGNAYLQANFPRLDYIKTARLLP
jgi:cyclophilin family peptidyl-prolyl cis-trans isomerase